MLVKTCGDCHGKKPKDNDLDLTSFGDAQAIIAKRKVLIDVAERLRLGDMPPKEAPQPKSRKNGTNHLIRSGFAKENEYPRQDSNL